jgi:hypothetical protein
MWCIKAWNGPINQGNIDIAALAALAGQATETNLGTARVATQAQVDVGMANDVIVTPKKLRAGFARLLSGNGYIAFPSWLGGLIVQWGSTTIISSTTVVAPLPIEYPNAQLFGIGGHSSSAGAAAISAANFSKSSIQLNMTVSGTATVRFLSIGY